MTELRDARFKRALDTAPDGDAAPQDQTRRAIREAALRAVAPGQPRRWLWWPARERRMPWNAAFATVLLAGLVTLLWQGQEVPDGRTDAPRDGVAAPQTPAATPEPTPRAQSAPAREELHKAAPEELARLRDAPGVRQESAAADTAAARAPTPATPSARSAAAARAPDSEPAAQSQAPDWRQWTQLRIERQGRSLVIPRERAMRLGTLLNQVVPERSDGEPFTGRVTLSIELNRQDELLGQLDVAGDRVRWTTPDAPARTARPDPTLLKRLQTEARRRLPPR